MGAYVVPCAQRCAPLDQSCGDIFFMFFYSDQKWRVPGHIPRVQPNSPAKQQLNHFQQVVTVGFDSMSQSRFPILRNKENRGVCLV